MTGQATYTDGDQRPEKSQVQVIARAAAILRSLEDEPAGLSLAQIAQRVGLARSTVQRIVAALGTEKLLIAASPTERVTLGPAILRLAASTRVDLAARLRPILVELSAALHETVDLARVERDHLLFIDQVVSSQRLRTVSAVGEVFPLHCSANGKAYLAMLTDDEIAALIGKNYKRHTGATHTTLKNLLKDVAQIRKNGIAFDLGEHSADIFAVGIAFFDISGNAFAISIPMPAARFQAKKAKAVQQLVAVKASLLSLPMFDRF
jgi:DNA-binding IclR family transcriptional regulator